MLWRDSVHVSARTLWLQTAIAINQSPSLREKAILLVKLMQHVEKRFPDDTDLNAQFLDLVNYIYRCVPHLGSYRATLLSVLPICHLCLPPREAVSQ